MEGGKGGGGGGRQGELASMGVGLHVTGRAGWGSMGMGVGAQYH